MLSTVTTLELISEAASEYGLTVTVQLKKLTGHSCSIIEPFKMNCLQVHSEPFDKLNNLDEFISNCREVVERLGDDHPDKPNAHSKLGLSQQSRFTTGSGELADLENSISNLSKAAELTPYGHTNKAMHLCNLGLCQQLRFKHL